MTILDVPVLFLLTTPEMLFFCCFGVFLTIIIRINGVQNFAEAMSVIF